VHDWDAEVDAAVHTKTAVVAVAVVVAAGERDSAHAADEDASAASDAGVDAVPAFQQEAAARKNRDFYLPPSSLPSLVCVSEQNKTKQNKARQTSRHHNQNETDLILDPCVFGSEVMNGCGYVS